MTDQPLPNPHPNRDACLALIGQYVIAPHPKIPDLIIEGIVVAYDPRPWQASSDGDDYLVINPDKMSDDVCHSEWVTVRFDSLIGVAVRRDVGKLAETPFAHREFF